LNFFLFFVYTFFGLSLSYSSCLFLLDLFVYHIWFCFEFYLFFDLLWFFNKEHKSSRYIEFVEESATQASLMALNDLELGGLKIFVRNAIIDCPFPEGMAVLEKIPAANLPPPVEEASQPTPKITVESINARISSLAASNPSQRPPNMTNLYKVLPNSMSSVGNVPSQTIASEENMSISSSQRYEIMQKLAQRTNLATNGFQQNQSPVLLLKNMVTPVEIDDGLKGEIEEECSKYGSVTNVVIHVDSNNSKNEELVKIFVAFSTPADCEKGRQALDKRWFAGKQIQAIPFDESKFKNQDYNE